MRRVAVCLLAAMLLVSLCAGQEASKEDYEVTRTPCRVLKEVRRNACPEEQACTLGPRRVVKEDEDGNKIARILYYCE